LIFSVCSDKLAFYLHTQTAPIATHRLISFGTSLEAMAHDEKPSQKPFRVVIVGAGIVGLSLSHALQ
jgi:threonine dehydrogenase-like Zn-dependent dehydrogenase